MGTDTIISGVIRGVLPYAVIGGVGFLGYMWLNKNGYLDGIKGAVNVAAEVPSKLVDEIKSRTGITDAQNGNWIGAAQNIIRTTVPIVNVGEAAYNAVKDDLPDITPPQLPSPPQITPQDGGSSEDFWQSKPVKYIPAVAARNALVRVFGR